MMYHKTYCSNELFEDNTESNSDSQDNNKNIRLIDILTTLTIYSYNDIIF